MTTWVVDASTGSDSNDGLTLSSAFKTPEYALTQASSTDKIQLVGGQTYLLTDQLHLDDLTDMVIEAVPSTGEAILDGSGGLANFPCIRLSNTATNNTLRNLALINSGTSGLIGTDLCDSSGLLLEDVRLADNTGNGNDFGPASTGDVTFTRVRATDNGADGISQRGAVILTANQCYTSGHVATESSNGYTTHNTGGMIMNGCVSEDDRRSIHFTATGVHAITDTIIRRAGSTAVRIEAAGSVTTINNLIADCDASNVGDTTVGGMYINGGTVIARNIGIQLGSSAEQDDFCIAVQAGTLTAHNVTMKAFSSARTRSFYMNAGTTVTARNLISYIDDPTGSGQDPYHFWVIDPADAPDVQYGAFNGAGTEAAFRETAGGTTYTYSAFVNNPGTPPTNPTGTYWQNSQLVTNASDLGIPLTEATTITWDDFALSPGAATTGVGENLTGTFTEDAAGYTRPAIGPWDLGALLSGELQLQNVTRHFDTGAQLIMSPSWWMDDKTSPTWARTNASMARVEVSVTGTSTFGLVFGDSCYSDNNRDGAALSIRLAPFIVRAFVEGRTAPEWTYGVRPSVGPYTFFSNLDADQTYRIQLETSGSTDSTVNMTPSFETMRQIDGDFSPITNYEGGAFVEVSGVTLDPGGTCNTVDRTGEGDPLNVLIHGDSISFGIMDTYEEPSYQFNSPMGPIITIEALSDLGDAVVAGSTSVQGSIKTVFRSLLDTYAESANRRLVILNSSLPGHWQGTMPTVQRTYYTTSTYGARAANTLSDDYPGLPLDLKDRLTQRTNEPSTDWTVGATDWTSAGFTPDLVMIGTFSNDLLQARWGDALVKSGVPGGANTDWLSPAYKNAVFARAGSLVEDIRTLWPAAKLAIIYGPKDGDAVAPILVTSGLDQTIQSDIDTGVSDATLWYDVSGRDAGDIAFFSMHALAEVTGYSDIVGGAGLVAAPGNLSYHPRAIDHEIYRAAWQPLLSALLDTTEAAVQTAPAIKGSQYSTDIPYIIDLKEVSTRALITVTNESHGDQAVSVRVVTDSTTTLDDLTSITPGRSVTLRQDAGANPKLHVYASGGVYTGIDRTNEQPYRVTVTYGRRKPWVAF